MKKSWRINLICFLFFALGITILSRLAYLQIVQGDFYRALAKGQQEVFVSLSGERGKIFLYDKEELSILATHRDYYLCYASPQEIENKEETAKALAESLGLERVDLVQKLEKDESMFVVLKRKLNEGEVESIEELNLPGIYLNKERYRLYPQNNLASDVLGFTDTEREGRYGIEGHFDDLLSGKIAWIKRKINPFGYPTEKSSAPPAGADIVLTLDKNIQIQAERLLEQAKEEFDIEGGQIIVVRPDSGNVIALADYPSFNPNQYGITAQKESLQIFKNEATQSLFEPGSMFKPITMAAALDRERITPETTYIDEGFVKVGGRTLHNYKGRVWGERTMQEVLEKSINTGAVFAESQIGDKIFLKYLERFGLFEETGIELQGEIFSQNSELKKGYKANFATASYGQGIEMTPLIFVRAFCVLANEGKLLQLHIVDEIKEDGQVTQTEPEVIREEVVSEAALEQLVKMLVGVIESGYGKKAGVPGYYIAGKTGTSQIPYTSLGLKKSGYSDKTWQSFVGFFPAFEPEFLILVKLDNPKTGTAEYSAAPIFGEMAQYIINYSQIPPDYE